jgi:transcriptional regulator with PAS, ATPase and Fis domain
MATPSLTVSKNVIKGTDFIVASEVMRKFMLMVERVAHHIGSVLIVGETGTGKERISHTIHEHSARCHKPFVEINCAALPENLVESELFGYEKGAFSGADTAKPGLFELAHSGTIFLDEIGELDLRMQVKLLRILDHAPYYRLGGHRKIDVDVRVVAATNRNLKEEVSLGRFRKDLYHRLTQFELSVPPLRERPDDCVALALHFLALAAADRRFSPEALSVLQSHSWPGNVRELQNIVNRVAVSAAASEITVLEVRQELGNSNPETAPAALAPPSTNDLDSLEAQAVRRALSKTGGHRGQAAAELGISRRTLSRRLRDYGLSSARGEAKAPLGTLHYDQERLFRADLQIPVSVRTPDGAELSCTSRNLSMSGLGVEGLPDTLDRHVVLHVNFLLPGSTTPVDVAARLAWLGARGRAGMTFAQIGPAARTEIARWLREKMTAEGWNVDSVPSPR